MPLSSDVHWKILEDVTADQFIETMLALGDPTEVTLVGVFGKEGRGSRQDMELPLHRDGEYSARKAAEKGMVFDKKIDYVGLYCIRGGDTVTTLECRGETHDIVLNKGQALVMDNRVCRHGRRGSVGDRLLLRVWIEARGEA